MRGETLDMHSAGCKCRMTKKQNLSNIMSHVVLYYHIVWRTKRSEWTITERYEKDLYAYIHGYCRNKGCTLIRINGMPDHIHLLTSIRSDIAVSEFVQVLKTESSKWLKTQKVKFPFFDGWGNGYAAFTYSEHDKEMIRHYIMKQKEHHKEIPFRKEYDNMLIDWGLNPEDDLFFKD